MQTQAPFTMKSTIGRGRARPVVKPSTISHPQTFASRQGDQGGVPSFEAAREQFADASAVTVTADIVLDQNNNQVNNIYCVNSVYPMYRMYQKKCTVHFILNL